METVPAPCGYPQAATAGHCDNSKNICGRVLVGRFPIPCRLRVPFSRISVFGALSASLYRHQHARTLKIENDAIVADFDDGRSAGE